MQDTLVISYEVLHSFVARSHSITTSWNRWENSQMILGHPKIIQISLIWAPMVICAHKISPCTTSLNTALMYAGSRIITSVSKWCVIKSYVSDYDGEEEFLIDCLDKYRYISKRFNSFSSFTWISIAASLMILFLVGQATQSYCGNIIINNHGEVLADHWQDFAIYDAMKACPFIQVIHNM